MNALRCLACALAVAALPAIAFADPASDFDDGTLQGWTKVLPFGGNLYNPNSGGNPNGYMHCDDTVAGGGGLQALAPAAFTGDLSVYTTLSWDEYLFACTPPPSRPTFPLLVGSGTVYRELDPPTPVTGIWRDREVQFVESEWELVSGTATFADVLANVDELRMEMDCNSQCLQEAGIDNIWLGPIAPVIPDPLLSSAVWTNLCGGTTGFVCPAGDGDGLTVTIRDSFNLPMVGVNVRVQLTSTCGMSRGAPAQVMTGAGGVANIALPVGLDASALPAGCTVTASVECMHVPIHWPAVAAFQDTRVWVGPDIDGDCSVGPADLAILQGDFTGPYARRSDLNCDGFVNVMDIAIFQGHLFHACTSIVDAPALLATGLDTLGPTRPNPFVGDTRIPFSIGTSGRVVLKVYDVTGRSIRTLVDELRAPDRYEVTWDGRNGRGVAVPSGVYFYRLETARVHETQKAVVLR